MLHQFLCIKNLPPYIFCDPTCLLKACIFLWVALQKIILTKDKFTKMGFEGPSRCPLCKKESKTFEHLLYDRPIAKNCWYWLCKKLNWQTTFPDNLLICLKSWLKHGFSKVYSNLWKISPSILLWGLWKQRNRIIFCNEKMDPTSFFNKLEACIIEVANNNIRKSNREEGSFSDHNDNICKN